MLDELSEDLKKILLAGIGAAATTVEASKELVEKLIAKGQITVEQGKVLNEELKRNVKKTVKEGAAVVEEKAADCAAAVERKAKEFSEAVHRETKPDADSIIETMDSMSSEELEKIKTKLAELETKQTNDEEKQKAE